MSRGVRPALLAALLGASLLDLSAFADPLVARDTAHVGAVGAWSVGVFDPLRYAISEGLELEGHPLVFLVSPNLILRGDLGLLGGPDWSAGLSSLGLSLAGELGASVPTPAMRLAKGFLFPSEEKKIGLLIVPRVALVASHGERAGRVLTVRLETAVGVPITRTTLTPLGGIAPLELLFAPVTSTHRSRLGVAYDLPIFAAWRVRAQADAYLHGKNPSPFTFSARMSVDVGVGAQSRLALGAIFWNADTHAVDEATGARHRSNDFLPMIDFIWAGG